MKTKYTRFKHVLSIASHLIYLVFPQCSIYLMCLALGKGCSDHRHANNTAVAIAWAPRRGCRLETVAQTWRKGHSPRGLRGPHGGRCGRHCRTEGMSHSVRYFSRLPAHTEGAPSQGLLGSLCLHRLYGDLTGSSATRRCHPSLCSWTFCGRPPKTPTRQCLGPEHDFTGQRGPAGG